MKTEELKIKYPSGFEHAVHMTKERISFNWEEAEF